MVTAYIGLGSNLAGPLRGKIVTPEQQVKQALNALADLPETRVLQQSSLYRSKPLASADAPRQPDYINAVAAIETGLAAEQLLDGLQTIEASHQRVRDKKWGPRTLDADLLLYGNATINTLRLQVPHPGLPERAFVLYPLAEIAPALEIPGQGPITRLAAACPRDGLIVL
ncbi:MAG TPA: 2-amino-4-hydroxy-6-hydroxymethyldihydropteridine diphosphokinase [Gammaproteobacteria bacterium]|nr:2-amino-4-hydroxy-6-hydroxymethyldihydropteridine diphosphokinase [Gammaproteobacteria bacterium]